MRRVLGKRWLYGVAVVGASGILGTLAWVAFGPDEDPVRERRYRAESACLFAGEQGVRGPAAGPVWAGMQRASLETQVKVTYLSVSGSQTAQNAATYLGGLLQQKCDLLIAVDEAPVAAVAAVAAGYPHQRFAVVRGVAGANVSVMDGTEIATYSLLVERFGKSS